jgi:hypothetical protein
MRSRASRIRLKALQGVGQKNPDADHAKQCGNCLDHHKLSFRPRGNKTAGPAEQSKEFNEWCWLRRATDDFRQQTMSGRWQTAGEAGFRAAIPRLKANIISTSDGLSPTAGLESAGLRLLRSNETTAIAGRAAMLMAKGRTAPLLSSSRALSACRARPARKQLGIQRDHRWRSHDARCRECVVRLTTLLPRIVAALRVFPGNVIFGADVSL